MITTSIYIIIIFAVAIFVAAFLYLYKTKRRDKVFYILFFLRFLSVFTTLLLLINPKVERVQLWTVKPQLAIAIDNSSSIKHLKQSDKLTAFIKKIQNDKTLQDKFRISYFSFGSKTQNLDSLDFSEAQTNITDVLEQLDLLYADEPNVPVVLVTDGNQTYGKEYQYYQAKNTIYPIAVGDTTQYDDFLITQLNTNSYSWLGNTFPVEVFSLYKGTKPINTELRVFKNSKKIFSKTLHFNKTHKTLKTHFTLPADKLGLQFYEVQLKPIESEQNTRNNRKDFSIEILDQKSNILLLSSIYHPDLGAIKKSIEQNKQRQVKIQVGDFDTINVSEYQLVILYQPTTEFLNILSEIKKKAVNSFIITGTQTDWNVLNNGQEAFEKKFTSSTEESLAQFNPSFPEFVVKNIGFESLPPLKNRFGSIRFASPYQTLLYQTINGVKTNYPLLATYTVNNTKNVVLFGEGIWKWRMQSFIKHKSFYPFDTFFGNLIQYASQYQKHKQLRLSYNKLCYNNQSERIVVSLVDQNLQTDIQKKLWFHLNSKENRKSQKIPFFVKDQHYEVVLENLKKGTYNFTVSVENLTQQASGSFKVLDYNIEQQFNTANMPKLNTLALRSNTFVSTIDYPEKVLDSLKTASRYKSVQKSKKVRTPIINWYWLLAIIIVSLSSEWFIRKYRGLI